MTAVQPDQPSPADVDRALAKLSPSMKAELEYHLRARPDSIHDYDREAERWVRAVRRPTADAMVARGLLEEHRDDYPIGGRRGRLTDLGVAVRARLMEARRR